MPSEIRRKLKNTIKNYTDAQVKVREATSNEPWGPSSTVMGEIADLTYNVVAFSEIMTMIWKRLNDHGKNWRHVYKSLTLLEYIIKTGSERVAQQCKENIFAIQTLKDFQHVEDNKDQGVNVREKAKTLVSLLKDDERLKNERAKALKAKERFAQNSAGIGSQSAQAQFGKGAGSPHMSTKTDAPLADRQEVPGSASADSRLSEMDAARPATTGEEELQLQLALAMSKEQHDEELRKERTDDVRLQLAVQESIKEEDEQPPTSLVDLIDPSVSAPAPKPESADPWGLPAPPPTTHTHHHTQPPAQAPRSDPWGSAAPAPAQVIAAIPPAADNDPWGNTPAPVEPPPDPWGAPPPSQAIAAVSSAVNDPWSGSSTPANPSGSPWGTPSKNESTNSVEATGSGFDIFASSTNGGGNNGNIDNEFDLLSSRTVTQTTASPTNTTGGMLDVTGMQTLSMSEEDHRKKTPKDFLGANSNLVNLDNLVTKPAVSNMPPQPLGGSSTNPFDMSSMGAPSIDTNPPGSGLGDRMPTGYNPFMHPAPQPTPLSQIQGNPMSMNFQQTNSGMFPAPMAPVGGNYNQPVVGHQMHSNNPFL